jgi:hypothetical protein
MVILNLFTTIDQSDGCHQVYLVVRFGKSTRQISQDGRVAVNNAPIDPDLNAGFGRICFEKRQDLIPIVGKTIAGATQTKQLRYGKVHVE